MAGKAACADLGFALAGRRGSLHVLVLPRGVVVAVLLGIETGEETAQILGVATEGIKLGGAETTARRVEMLKAQVRSSANASDSDALDVDLGPSMDAAHVSPTGTADEV